MSDELYKEITGDATKPIGDGVKIIVHCCNDEGKWGAGFVIALSKRWRAPEKYYRRWYTGDIFEKKCDENWESNQAIASNKMMLGEIQLVKAEKDIIVCNLIGQHGVAKRHSKGWPPVRYEAIRNGLKKLNDMIETMDESITIHCPKFGSDLAGGNWNVIKQIVIEELCSKGKKVIVYNFEG